MDYDLTITTPPTADLVTLKRVKQQVRVEATETYDDPFLEDLLAEAIETVCDLADVTLLPTTYTLILPRFPRCSDDVISLPRSPLASVTSISYFDSNNDVQELVTAEVSTGDMSAISIELYQTWPATRRRKKAVTIVYTSGSATPPVRARRAVLLLVAHWYHDREGEHDTPQSVMSIIEQLRPGDDFHRPLTDI